MELIRLHNQHTPYNFSYSNIFLPSGLKLKCFQREFTHNTILMSCTKYSVRMAKQKLCATRQ